MAFREVPMFEVREALRLWLQGQGVRSIERLAGLDRKTVRRYVQAAVDAGVVAGGGEAQLTDVVLGEVVLRVNGRRDDGHGPGWASLVGEHARIVAWLDDGLTVVKVHELLARQGVVVAQRTLHRYVLEVIGHGRGQGRTVRVNDGEPGGELQIDYAKMGLINDPVNDRRRVCHALIFTAVFSRHLFVWLSFGQTTGDVIAGCEVAWRFFNGVFKVVIPDNLAAVVTKADKLEPRLNQAFVEYAQARGFIIDPARVRTPTDKPRVERMVQFVRGSWWQGETFIDLADAQRRVEEWCRVRAGMRVHGTIQCHPLELFNVEERPCLLPVPVERYDVPVYAVCKVHRDHHIEIARALYSVPGNLIGARVDVRADSRLVKIFSRGQLVKVHPRQQPGHRVTDPADLPAHTATYALRDIEQLKTVAAKHGPAVGVYAAAVLDHPLPWTKMRQVYALIGLANKFGDERLNQACQRALEAEAINVGLITRMLNRATENSEQPPEPEGTLITARFARDPDEFRPERPDRAAGGHPGNIDNAVDAIGDAQAVNE